MFKIKTTKKIKILRILKGLFKRSRSLIVTKHLTSDIVLTILVALVVVGLANHASLSRLFNLTDKSKPVVSSKIPKDITVSKSQTKPMTTTSTPTVSTTTTQPTAAVAS